MSNTVLFDTLKKSDLDQVWQTSKKYTVLYNNKFTFNHYSITIGNNAIYSELNVYNLIVQD